MTEIPSSAEAPEGLRRGAVSASHLVFFVVAAAAPLTVLTGLTPLQFAIGGEAVPAGFLIAGAVYLIFAVGFTSMSRHVRNTGAFFAYIAHGLGNRIGAGSAMVAYAAYTLGHIGFCSVAGLFASVAIKTFFGFEVYWAVSAFVIGLLVAAVSYLRVEAGARLLAIMLLAELGILVVLMGAILIQGVPEGYSLSSFDPASWPMAAIGPLLVVTFVVFIGFEQTAVYSEEVADPARTVPKATYAAVLLLAVIYTAFSWLILMAAGPSTLTQKLAVDPQSFVFNINTAYVGATMTDFMLVLIVTSFIAGVLALHNAASRYLYALGRSRILPSLLSATNPSTGSPGNAVVTQAVIVLVSITGFGLSPLDPYTQVVIWTNTPTLVGVLFLQLLTSVAVIAYFRRDNRGERTWNRLVAPAISVVLLAAVLFFVCTQLGILTYLGPLGNFLINAPLILAFIVGVLRAPTGSPEALLNDEL